MLNSKFSCIASPARLRCSITRTPKYEALWQEYSLNPDLIAEVAETGADGRAGGRGVLNAPKLCPKNKKCGRSSRPLCASAEVCLCRLLLLSAYCLPSTSYFWSKRSVLRNEETEIITSPLPWMPFTRRTENATLNSGFTFTWIICLTSTLTAVPAFATCLTFPDLATGATGSSFATAV